MGLRVVLLVVLALVLPVRAQGFDPHSPEEEQNMCRLFNWQGSDCEDAIEGFRAGVRNHEIFKIELEYLGLELALQRHIDRTHKLLEMLERRHHEKHPEQDFGFRLRRSG